jgi:hypothetical protein
LQRLKSKKRYYYFPSSWSKYKRKWRELCQDGMYANIKFFKIWENRK